jgi:hypothetical protein
MKIHSSKILPALALALLFLIGGGLQLMGLLSLTQSNYLVIALMVTYLLASPIRMGLSRSEAALLVLALYVALGPFVNGSTPINTVVYIYYLACPFISARFVERIGKDSDVLRSQVVFRWIAAFLFLQLVAVLFQTTFTTQLIAVSATPITAVDVASGTFYIKSDNTLSAFCALAALMAVWYCERPLVRNLILILSLTAVTLANSKAFQQITPLLIAWAFLESRFFKGRNLKVKIVLTAMLLALLLALFYQRILEELASFRLFLYEIYDYRLGGDRADRFAPLGEILNSPPSFFGMGALTYYNPITKEWYYNAGFSLFYSLYFDYGLWGLALALWYFLSLTIELGGKSMRSATLFGIFLVFFMFSPTITDLAFLTSFIGACMMVGAHTKLPRSVGGLSRLPGSS